MSRAASVLLLVAAAWFAVAADMAPVGGWLGGWSGPDLLFCVVALWTLRRPALTPAAVVLLLGLSRDLLSGGPVGAGALGLLLATEALRARAPVRRRGGFAAECLAASLAAIVALGAPWALLTVTLAPTPPIVALADRLGATVAAYPIVALALRWAVRVGPAPAPSEAVPGFAARGRAARGVAP
jgi:rod shape-determining protein MreD